MPKQGAKKPNTKAKSEPEKEPEKEGVFSFKPAGLDDNVPWIEKDKIMGKDVIVNDYDLLETRKFGKGVRLEFLVEDNPFLKGEIPEGEEEGKVVLFSEVMHRQLSEAEEKEIIEIPFKAKIEKITSPDSGLIYFSFV